MLNEKAEYLQYTGANAPERLRYPNLIRNRLSGLDRALIIIARHFLFDEKYEGQDRIDLAQNALKAWCGFGYDTKYSSIDDIKSLEARLPGYIRANFLKEKLDALKESVQQQRKSGEPLEKLHLIIGNTDHLAPQETLNALSENISAWLEVTAADSTFETDPSLSAARKKIKTKAEPVLNTINILYLLQNKNKQYSRSMFTLEYPKKEVSASNNDFKMVLYEKIIAEALNKGALCRYYLACSADALESISGYSEANRDLILKTTAAFFLCRSNPSLKFAPINRTDIANWSVDKQNPNKFTLEDYELSDGTKLFYTVRLGGNVTKLSLHEDWLKCFCLVGEEDIDAWLSDHGDRIYFSDAGSQDYLRKNERYQNVNVSL